MYKDWNHRYLHKTIHWYDSWLIGTARINLDNPRQQSKQKNETIINRVAWIRELWWYC